MSVSPYEEAERLSVVEAGSRQVESWALLELAKRLERARKTQADDADALAEVVRLNWRAWTVIQSSLLDEQNPLSAELRTDLLILCAFIDKHSTQLLSAPDAEKMQVLIDINMHLAQGLRGEPLSDDDQKAVLKARAQAVARESAQKSQNETNPEETQDLKETTQEETKETEETNERVSAS